MQIADCPMDKSKTAAMVSREATLLKREICTDSQHARGPQMRDRAANCYKLFKSSLNQVACQAKLF